VGDSQIGGDLIQDDSRDGGRFWMSSRTLSLDIRERVVAAVSNGLSRRQAAERFGVSPASAVRWCALATSTGCPAARPRGGDRLSHRIEAQAERIHALIAQKDDLTLSEIRTQLAEDGHHFAIGTLWRFFARHKITWKKRPLTRRNRIDRIS
jgi:transposase